MHPSRAPRRALQPIANADGRHRPDPQPLADLLPAALDRSGDRGETWDHRPLPPYKGSGGPSEIAFVDAQNGWHSTGGVPETECNGAGEQVWRTTDGGAGWQVVASVSGTRHDASNSSIQRESDEALSPLVVDKADTR